MKYAVFDIETRVDKDLIRSVFYRGENIGAEEAYARMRERLLEESDGRSDFFPLPLHVPVSIVVGNVGDDWMLAEVETLGAESYSEAGIVREFWDRLERFGGTLVSFNGRAFDLPVLELQALRHGYTAPAYFNEGRGYRHRYSERHYDLYDFLTNFGAFRIRGGFGLLAKLAGLPGKGAIDGSMVQEMWDAGRLSAIHGYCRNDVIQTYFLLLRVELLRGRLTREEHDRVWAATEHWRRQLEAGAPAE